MTESESRPSPFRAKSAWAGKESKIGIAVVGTILSIAGGYFGVKQFSPNKPATIPVALVSASTHTATEPPAIEPIVPEMPEVPKVPDALPPLDEVHGKPVSMSTPDPLPAAAPALPTAPLALNLPAADIPKLPPIDLPGIDLPPEKPDLKPKVIARGQEPDRREPAPLPLNLDIPTRKPNQVRTDAEIKPVQAIEPAKLPAAPPAPIPLPVPVELPKIEVPKGDTPLKLEAPPADLPKVEPPLDIPMGLPVIGKGTKPEVAVTPKEAKLDLPGKLDLPAMPDLTKADAPKVDPAPLAIPPVRPQPTDDPKTTGAPIPLPLGDSLNLRPPVAPVETRTPAPAPVKEGNADFDEDLHPAKVSDTFESVARQYYEDPRYAKALEEYNRANPPKTGDWRIPPVWVLKERHGNRIPAENKPPSAPPTPVEAPRASNPPTDGKIAPVEFRDIKPATRERAIIASSDDKNPPEPGEMALSYYEVPKGGVGETLEDVAKKAMGNANQAGYLLRLNPTLKANALEPLPPGTRLLLPPKK